VLFGFRQDSPLGLLPGPRQFADLARLCGRNEFGKAADAEPLIRQCRPFWAEAGDIQEGEQSRRHPPSDLIENRDMPGARQGFDLFEKVLADPRELGEVLAGVGHRRDAARQLRDHACGVPVGADAERVGAVEREEIGKLFQVARDIGFEDAHAQRLAISHERPDRGRGAPQAH
jgi:hypothetical protein